MSVPNSREIETLVKELRMVANMINMCEKIQWGRETTLMDSAADMLITIHQELQKAREEERKRIVDWLKQHGYYHEEHRALFETLQSELDQPII